MSEDTELCKLAVHYMTDKAPRTGHAYTPFYHDLLKDRRSAKKVLEIGIDLGRSLFMWRDYFPDATIYGLDWDASRLINEGRIQSYLCNQGDVWQLESAVTWAGSNFDLILDDGSHDPVHQVLTALILVPILAPNGIYIIEDMMRPDLVASQLPYKCEIVPFDIVRDPFSNVIVIRGGAL